MEQQGETSGGVPLCPLCGREIPPDVPQSRHHLIPRLRGGKGGETVLLHQICHSEIHATLSETELARSYNTVDALRAHPHLAKFIAWVVKRPPGFRSRSPGGRRRRDKG
ncbi:HNH endonuclease [Aliiroseovarius sp.]|uniref:HNH endonuclease n=1 Tax=Aliiroseovarius sp. TaxID=1872442 RepID=UPI003BAD3DCE